MITVAGWVQVGIEKLRTEDPPSKDTVRVKSIVVPQAKEDDVLTLKGVVFVPMAFSATSG